MDFTIKTYKILLESLIRQGYAFQTFAEFLEAPQPRCIILRHDVEARYENALVMAKIQHSFNIRGSYYFRFLPNHFDENIIREIASMSHEIGYHYDDLTHCKGNYGKAFIRFERNLSILRKITPVKTICMEGAPLSKYDNRDLWRQGEAGKRGSEEAGRQESLHASLLTSHYSDYGIIGEPYFDIDFSRVLYLTDTGRRWDGEKVSVRDKVGGRQNKFQIPSTKHQTNSKHQISKSKQTSNLKSQTSNLKSQTSNLKSQIPKFHSTYDIINASPLLPDQIMFTFHPQRWTDEPLPWLKELVMQNVKNVVKRVMLSGRRA